ncbi:MAG: 2-oxoacid:ferredoxin oxidoreductase subunit beta, partial [Bacteroidota bacterium]
GSDASFVARTMDRDPKHMGQMFRRAHAHKGAALVEIYQNCNIFNDGAFLEFTDRSTKALRTVYLEHGQPLVFDKGAKGLRLDGLRFEVIDLEDGTHSVDDCLVYDETNREMAYVASQLFWQADMPRPFGVFYREERPTYEQQLQEQLDAVREKRGAGDLANLLQGPETWVVSE